MVRRILVTGGSGFLGTHLLRSMAANNVRSDVLMAVSREPNEETSVVQHFFADLASEAICARLLEETRPSHVVHFAGAASVGASMLAAKETWRENFNNTFGLVSAIARMEKVPAFIFASSSEVYGESCDMVGDLDERVAARPVSVYGRTKFAAELAATDLLKGRGACAILRFFNAVGPRQDERFVVAAFASQLARIEAGLASPILRVGNLSSVRDFIDVEDLVASVPSVLSYLDGRRAAEVAIFNVASGEGRSILSIVEDLRGLCRVPITLEVDAARARPNEIHRVVGNSARLRRETGWEPTRPWLATIARTLEYWRNRATSLRAGNVS